MVSLIGVFRARDGSGGAFADGCDDSADLTDLFTAGWISMSRSRPWQGKLQISQATPPIFELRKSLVFGLRLTSGGSDRVRGVEIRRLA